MDRIDRVARERFGYESLRPGQEEALRSVLDGHDTLAVTPTGSGKSAIYQISGLVIPGPTVVISPLIALQRDQVESIEEQEASGAAQVNSTARKSDRQEAFEDLEEGDLEFLFIAPEQFDDEGTLERIREAEPSLFVVDEAHCISEWGHDFRLAYLWLGAVIKALGRSTVLALTATASPLVREEIVERLRMRDPRTVARGFDRPNIWLGVERFKDEEAKKRALLGRVAEAEKPGIVYAATRKGTEEIAEGLLEPSVASKRPARSSSSRPARWSGASDTTTSAKPPKRRAARRRTSSGSEARWSRPPRRAPGDLVAAIQAFAAGAILTMLASN